MLGWYNNNTIFHALATIIFHSFAVHFLCIFTTTDTNRIFPALSTLSPVPVLLIFSSKCFPQVIFCRIVRFLPLF